MLSVIFLSVVMLVSLCWVSQKANYAECDFPECSYAVCHYVECHYAEWHGARLLLHIKLYLTSSKNLNYLFLNSIIYWCDSNKVKLYDSQWELKILMFSISTLILKTSGSVFTTHLFLHNLRMGSISRSFN